jgi:hypothetical protein
MGNPWEAIARRPYTVLQLDQTPASQNLLRNSFLVGYAGVSNVYRRFA